MSFPDMVIEQTAFVSWLEHLINQNLLDGAPLGVTRQAIDKGVDSLTEKQRQVFDRHVVQANQQCCDLCGDTPPWPEQVHMSTNGGLCGACYYRLNKDD